jgi:hypothetical protein
VLVIAQDSGILTFWDIEKEAEHSRTRIGSQPLTLRQTDPTRLVAFSSSLAAFYDGRAKKHFVFWEGAGLVDLTLTKNLAAMAFSDRLLLYELGVESRATSAPLLFSQVAFQDDWLLGLGPELRVQKLECPSLKKVAESDRMTPSAKLFEAGIVADSGYVVFD